MSRIYDVIIERENGHFRATLASLPGLSAEADTRDEALWQLQQAATSYLQRVELATIEIEMPATALRPGSPQAVLNAINASKLDVESDFYQEYLRTLSAKFSIG